MTTPTLNDRGARFAELGVPAPLIAALAERGVDEPFPIQTAFQRLGSSSNHVRKMRLECGIC